MEKTIYVAGPISNMPNLNKEAFNEATKKLRGLGYIVINPHELCEGIPAEEWEKCMRICIKRLMDADIIVLLNGYQRSRGAHLEYTIAQNLNLTTLKIDDILAIHETKN